MSVQSTVEKSLDQGKGILRLSPTWVPRSFCVPGRRIKLHPADYYALGGDRGGIDERWFSSTTPADNGPKTSKDEGLSFIVLEEGSRVEKVTLRDAIAELKGRIIGERHLERVQGVAHVLQVLRQQGTASAPRPPQGTAREARGADGEAGVLLLPGPEQQLRGGFPVHLLRSEARDHEGPAARVSS